MFQKKCRDGSYCDRLAPADRLYSKLFWKSVSCPKTSASAVASRCLLALSYVSPPATSSSVAAWLLARSVAERCVLRRVRVRARRTL